MSTEKDIAAQTGPNTGAKAYEKSDASAFGIFGVILFLVLGGFSIQFILSGFLGKLNKTITSQDASQTDGRNTHAQIPQHSSPKIQVAPSEELAAFRRREEEEVLSFGWIDKSAGVVRIPVDKAMDLVLEKGLPYRKGINQTSAKKSMVELQNERVESNKRGDTKP